MLTYQERILRRKQEVELGEITTWNLMRWTGTGLLGLVSNIISLTEETIEGPWLPYNQHMGGTYKTTVSRTHKSKTRSYSRTHKPKTRTYTRTHKSKTRSYARSYKSKTRNNKYFHKFENRNANKMIMNTGYTVDDLLYTSAEYIYDILRFDIFTHTNPKNLIDLFTQMVYVPLKEPTIFTNLVEIINKKDFNGLVALVEKHKIPDYEKQLDNMGFHAKYKPNYKMIFNMYFSINDRNLAMKLLKYLIFTDCENKETFDELISYLKSFTEKDLENYLPNIMYNSFVF
jgi:hypothetical protein